MAFSVPQSCERRGECAHKQVKGLRLQARYRHGRRDAYCIVLALMRCILCSVHHTGNNEPKHRPGLVAQQCNGAYRRYTAGNRRRVKQRQPRLPTRRRRCSRAIIAITPLAAPSIRDGNSGGGRSTLRN